MIVEGFILSAYVLGTGFGIWFGNKRGHTKGIEDTIDSLIEKGYLKHRGNKHNPDIIKWNEKH
jgi:hypothetical protein